METRTILLKIDISGTRNDEAWRELKHFHLVCESGFGRQYGTSGPCHHSRNEPHRRGEWRGGFVKVEPFVAEFALPHYLDQPRVLEAEIQPPRRENH